MPIISKGGRRGWKTLTMITLMYAVLLVGSLSMLYPFALMLGGSLCTGYDFDDFELIPTYLRNDEALLKKRLFDKYGNQNFQSLAFQYKRDSEWINWNDIRIEKDFLQRNYAEEMKLRDEAVADWFDFKKSLPANECGLYFETDVKYYQNFLRALYNGDIASLNRCWGRSFNQFGEVRPMFPMLFEQRYCAPERVDYQDYLAAMAAASPERLQVASLREMWSRYLHKKYISPDRFKAMAVKNFSEVPVGLEPDWSEFLRVRYPLRLVTVNGVGLPAEAARRSQWMEDTLKTPLAQWELNDPDSRWQSFLETKYADIAQLNLVWGSEYTAFSSIEMPFKLEDYHDFMSNKSQYRRAYLLANYKSVLSFLTSKGRAISVTLVLILLSVGCALTINPLAAYALSRGRQSVSMKLLIFFLATMPFPAEVGMIPGFLLIRDLGLLNTMGALLLPGLANGYSIFLLKGFFDSIPRELYEAADIDGASEVSKFLRITFPMSLPILAVIALGAFTAAYGGFMWAFLTCQDPNMWTIMVWIYDFQGKATNQGEVFAALTVAAIPTMLVFIFCQKIIMRGIVIPTMK